MIDFHLHPSYSIDSRAGIEAMVAAAIEKRLAAICFTTHIDLNPDRECLDYYMRCDGVLMRYCAEGLNKYIREVGEAADKFSDDIEIFLGYELSYGQHFEDRIEEFLDTYPADFVIGAVHCLENISITASSEAAGYFRATDIKKAVEDYVSATIQLIESGLFRTVGHIDGIKKYGRVFYGTNLDTELAKVFAPVFDSMRERRVGFELNTSALRKGLSEIYPSGRLLEMAADSDVKINSTGSDAHRPEDVGFALDLAEKLISKMGLSVGEPLAGYM